MTEPLTKAEREKLIQYARFQKSQQDAGEWISHDGGRAVLLYDDALTAVEQERDALKARLEAVIAAVNTYAQKQHAGEYWETCANEDCEALARALKGKSDE